MKAFSQMLDRLAFTPSRNGKLRHLAGYFDSVPDPHRGYALAALTGGLSFTEAKPAQIRALVESRVDPVLFGWSYDYVGDLAETVALIWPQRPGANREPELAEVVERLAEAKRSEVPALLEAWLDALDASGRWALLKLITGGLRIGVSGRLARTAVAEWRGADLGAIEEVWHGLEPPYLDLFAWLEGRAGRPKIDRHAVFHPLMLAQPLEDEDVAKLEARDYLAEWKWDGIRVQLAAGGGRARLFSRSGDDISRSFPDIVAAADFDAVLDGELLVVRDGEVAPFNDLQQRLNLKSVSANMLEGFPDHLRL